MPTQVIHVKYYRPPIALGPMCSSLLDFAWTSRTLFIERARHGHDIALEPLHAQGIPRYVAAVRRFSDVVTPGQVVDLETEERALRSWLSRSADVAQAGAKAQAFLDYTNTTVAARAAAMEAFVQRMSPTFALLATQLTPPGDVACAGDSSGKELLLRALGSMFAWPEPQQVYAALMDLALMGWQPPNPKLSLAVLRNLCLWSREESRDAFVAFLLGHALF